MKYDADLIGHQRDLEKMYNKNQLIPRIKEEFRKVNLKGFTFKEHFEYRDIPEGFGFDILAQMALHKRCSLPTLVGIMSKHFDDMQEVTDMIKRCAEEDLLDWSPTLQIFIVNFTITAAVQDEIDRYQFPLPLVVLPKEVKNNRDTGMYTSNGSLILKDNHHDEDICLDHINSCNQIPLVINWEVAKLIKNQWRNLDKPKLGELKEDFLRRKKAFDKYDRTAFDVMHEVVKYSPVFYLTHKYCKRGRTHCQGYHVNYQGTPWNKAVVEFADKEVTN